jgi:inosose dehydratase
MLGPIELGSAPINWGVEGVVPGNPDPNEMLAAIAADGYAGCELGAHGYFGYETEAILAAFRRHRLALITSWYGVDLATPLDPSTAGELRLIASFLQAGGATTLLISDKMTPQRVGVVARVDRHPETWWSDADWQQVPATLLQIHELVARFGLQVAVHPHVGTHLETGVEIRRMLDATAGGPIKLCVDTGHTLLGGSDPIALIEQEGDRLVHVHAKDVHGPLMAEVREGRQDYFEAIGNGLYCDLGLGLVDWQAVKRALASCDYAGWVVAEEDQLLKPSSRQPYESNTLNYRFLSDLLRD